MKYAFKTDDSKEPIWVEIGDSKEAKRIVHSRDMALVLWDITHNNKHRFPESYDYHPFLEKICDLLHDHGIIIDDLV